MCKFHAFSLNLFFPSVFFIQALLRFHAINAVGMKGSVTNSTSLTVAIDCRRINCKVRTPFSLITSSGSDPNEFASHDHFHKVIRLHSIPRVSRRFARAFQCSINHLSVRCLVLTWESQEQISRALVLPTYTMHRNLI